MKSHVYGLGGVALLVAAYAVHSATPPPNLHEQMKNIVAMQTQAIWDVGNKAQDDQGNPDPSKLAAGDWSKIIDASVKVRQVAQTLAQSEHVLVAPPGVKIDGE